MTAAALQCDRERCLAAGMDDYIAKPVLVADVEAVLLRLGGEVTTVKVMAGLCEQLEVLARAGALSPAGDLLCRLEQEVGHVTSVLDAVVVRR